MTEPERYRVDPRTLDMLVCPLTKTRLTLSPDRTELISQVARRAFPIRKGVPLLVLDAASEVSEEEIDALRRRG
jgi:uncharacterized protein